MDTNDKRNQSGGMFGRVQDEFAVRSATAITGFNFEDAPPPGWCYIGVDDKLLLWIQFQFNIITAICNVRILRPDGIIVPLVFTLNGPTSRVVFSQSFQLLEGFLLSCTITANGAVSNSNLAFATASIIRPPNGITQQYEVLCSGYLNGQNALTFPGGVPARPSDGPGQPHVGGSLGVGAPAAGADIVFTMPAGARGRIVSISALLTTAVAVANRLPSLIVDDGATAYAVIPSGNTQAASLVQQYTWADSCPQVALFDSKVIAPLPSNLVLPPGHRIRTSTTGIQAADQWSAINLMGHEWVDVG